MIGFEQVVGSLSYMVYPDRNWVTPMADGTPAKPSGVFNLSWINAAGGYLALDSRINFFTNYYSISLGIEANQGRQRRGARHVRERRMTLLQCGN